MNIPHIKYTESLPDGQVAFNPLPAVAIGGPPHSGKSVLSHDLTKALRCRKVEHYRFLAYPPDYEGDWFLEGEREQMQKLRRKGAPATEVWLQRVMRDLANRHLPLLVDCGGRPTLAQEQLLDHCTHAILLTRDAASHREWAERMARHGLVLLADLNSVLDGQNVLVTGEPLIRGTLAGLERGTDVSGPVFDALIARLEKLFRRATPGLRQRHLDAAPVELVVDIQQLAQKLGIDPNTWQPGDLPRVVDYLPQGQPLAVYGRGPNWLYALIAVLARPAPFYIFDPRRGWVAVPELTFGAVDPEGPFTVETKTLAGVPMLDFRFPETYVEIESAEGLAVPLVDSHHSLVLSGKIPLWLYASLARLYAGLGLPWLAIFQPQVEGAVVVATQGQKQIGDLL